MRWRGRSPAGSHTVGIQWDMAEMGDLCQPGTVRVAAGHQAEARKIATELAKIARSGMVLPGSVTERRTRCGRANCGCHADPPPSKPTRACAGSAAARLTGPADHRPVWAQPP